MISYTPLNPSQEGNSLLEEGGEVLFIN